MSKKYVVLLMLCISCFLLTGCGDVIDITDDETKLIAEYAAEILLKYDVNFKDRINEGEKIQKELDEEVFEQEMSGTTQQVIADDNETEATEADNIQEDTEQATSESDDDMKNRNRDSRINSNDDENNVSDSDSDNSNSDNESDIGKILGFDGISITYNDYIITDQYPATDADGQFIYLEATEGYQLLVLRFNISNTSDDTMNLTMLDEEIDYKIVCNKKHAANPMLTILMNDLETIETTLSSKEVQEGVLIFQISNDMKDKLENMELKVEHNNTENVITIL